MISFLFWLSGAILMAAEWQLEIIRIRASRKELFSTPLYILTGRNYKGWSLVCLMAMLVSYAMVILAGNGAAVWVTWAGAALFLIGFWQLCEMHFKTIALKPYHPPMWLAWATEEIEMDLGTKKMDRRKHVSFWGDIWLLFIFAAYVIAFL